MAQQHRRSVPRHLPQRPAKRRIVVHVARGGAPQDRYGSYAGLGVRIEDDVVCTVTGAEVLSAGVPVDPDQAPHPPPPPPRTRPSCPLSFLDMKAGIHLDHGADFMARKPLA